MWDEDEKLESGEEFASEGGDGNGGDWGDEEINSDEC